MKKLTLCLFALFLLFLLSGCDKIGVSGTIDHVFGNWAEVKLPAGCQPKQIAGEEGSGVILLCQDGRIFH